MAALIGSLMLATVGVMIRSLKEIPGQVVVFYHALGGFIVTGAYMAWKAHHEHSYYRKLMKYSEDQY